MIATTSRRAAIEEFDHSQLLVKKASKRPGGFRRGVSTKD
jgi:hypothetical protein